MKRTLSSTRRLKLVILVNDKSEDHRENMIEEFHGKIYELSGGLEEPSKKLKVQEDRIEEIEKVSEEYDRESERTDVHEQSYLHVNSISKKSLIRLKIFPIQKMILKNRNLSWKR